MILSVDPGGTTGWALWTLQMEPVDEGQASIEMMNELLIRYGHTLETIIYEDFIGYKNKVSKMAGSRFEASQVIGALKFASTLWGIELIRQPASILGIAAMHSGRPQPKNHAVSHVVDSFNHGYYWGVKEGLLKTALQLKAEADKL